MSTPATDVLDGIARGEFHRRGALTNARLFDLEPAYFDRLRREVLELVASRQGRDLPASWQGSDLAGTVAQFSLVNESGDLSDASTDHHSTEHQRFHHAAAYPAIAELVEQLPPLINLRINVLPPMGGFAPHHEQVSSREGRDYSFRARFHLPIQTNPQALVLLEGDLFHFDAGSAYYFNDGCNHSAENRGDEPRIHLLWDLPLTSEAIEVMFGQGFHGPLLRTPVSERFSEPVGHLEVEHVVIQADTKKWYDRLRLERLGVSQEAWSAAFSTLRFGRYTLWGRPVPVGASDPWSQPGTRESASRSVTP